MTWRRSGSPVVVWLGNRDLQLLLAILVIVGGGWFFIELTDMVQAGSTEDFDHRVIRAMRRPSRVDFGEVRVASSNSKGFMLTNSGSNGPSVRRA